MCIAPGFLMCFFFLGLNPGHQARGQELFPAESSCQPLAFTELCFPKLSYLVSHDGTFLFPSYSIAYFTG